MAVAVSFCKNSTSLKNNKMAEELQKYKDILKREREEFKKAAGERGKHLEIPFILIENGQYFELNEIEIL